MNRKVIYCLSLVVVVSAAWSCDQKKAPLTPATESKLKQATDVFWMLDQLGYMVSKETPNPASHSCVPFEYLAKKDRALFRISVFECPDADQARALTQNPGNQKVDSLLRNHKEGGVLQRGPLQIIIRRAEGDETATTALIQALESH